jgi:hypothetical protein
MLVSQTPGGLYERFFEEVGKPVTGEAVPLVLEDQPNLERIVAIGVQYGIEIPPPTTQRSRA